MSSVNNPAPEDLSVFSKDPDLRKPEVSQAPAATIAPDPATQEAERLVKGISDAGSESILDTKRNVSLQGFTLRPVTLASVELLRTINSPLILGVKVANPTQLLGDVLEFIMLHSLPEEEAIDHVFKSPEDRKKCVLRWAMPITIRDTKSLVAEVITTLSKATGTQVKAEPPEHVKKAMDSEKMEGLVSGSGNG